MGTVSSSEETVDTRFDSHPAKDAATVPALPVSPPGEWDVAQERVLFYLTLLNIPAPLRLQLALEALTRAQYDRSGKGAVTAAMVAIRELLAEREAEGSLALTGLLSGFERRGSGYPSTPPFNRGFITLNEFDRTTILTMLAFVVGVLIRGFIFPIRLLLRPVCLFFMLFIFLSLWLVSELS